MENLNLIIGNKLKYIRSKRNLSLDELSKLTGVSKAMLGQIERGQSNPTVSTLWKIATGLKVSFSVFIDESNDELNIIDQEDIIPIIEENSKMRLYPIFPFDISKGFEIFTIELESGCIHPSTPHNDEVEEYILVTQGEIEMIIDNKSFRLKKGNSLNFKANKSHTYKNISDSTAIFQNIILYKKIE
ncbi:helix-turn-helix domain protein [Clostridium sp. DL-VIII]|uniref:helix-turn-helix domain-containing protein n=1 Tax=Clostridium sp. DL-VIII TaxID=641107 RepID=UPI00023B08C4|nr:XRE family transcriptional regulator [Clostridium sp. DL-VIII]EHJ02238.1 helix-turn-helix domain protein [Clostridium sp. DL-VIII]